MINRNRVSEISGAFLESEEVYHDDGWNLLYVINLFSFLFPNMYISSCITCLYVYKLEIKCDLIYLQI